MTDSDWAISPSECYRQSYSPAVQILFCFWSGQYIAFCGYRPPFHCHFDPCFSLHFVWRSALILHHGSISTNPWNKPCLPLQTPSFAQRFNPHWSCHRMHRSLAYLPPHCRLLPNVDPSINDNESRHDLTHPPPHRLHLTFNLLTLPTLSLQPRLLPAVYSTPPIHPNLFPSIIHPYTATVKKEHRQHALH